MAVATATVPSITMHNFVAISGGDAATVTGDDEALLLLEGTVEEMLEAAEEKTKKVWKTIRSKHETATIFKLKRMMKAGIPRGTVEQQAHLAGIKIDSILGAPSSRRKKIVDPSMAKRCEECRAAQDASKKRRLLQMAKVGVPIGGGRTTSLSGST
jgi:hypothetical protein